jgi:uncharacterized protein (UPF0332 family)
MAERNTDLSKHRFHKAKDDLEASRLLFDNNKLGQSINRSYYSIFHAVRALLALENFDSRKHTGIIAFFNKQFVKTGKIGKEYSKILMDAQDFRNDSDYDDFFVVSKEEALAQIDSASRFIKMIENFILENY